jgi:hypothetical protein
MQRRKVPKRAIGARARWRRAEERAQAERDAGIPDREAPVDQRDVIFLDLRRRGGKLLRIEPRGGYIADRWFDHETGEFLFKASIKEALHKVADDLPRCRAPDGGA